MDERQKTYNTDLETETLVDFLEESYHLRICSLEWNMPYRLYLSHHLLSYHNPTHKRSSACTCLLLCILLRCSDGLRIHKRAAKQKHLFMYNTLKYDYKKSQLKTPNEIIK